jgi:hypothetical protein
LFGNQKASLAREALSMLVENFVLRSLGLFAAFALGEFPQGGSNEGGATASRLCRAGQLVQ